METAVLTPKEFFITLAGVDAGMQAVLQLLARALQPEKIFLLRHARQERVYAQLFLIMPDNCPVPFTKLEPCLDFACAGRSELSCTLLKWGRLLQLQQQGHIYFSQVLIPQNLAYDAGNRALPEVLPLANEVMLQEAREHFYSSLGRAARFYEGACYYLECGSDELALFQLHQSFELALRALIGTLGGHLKRTHEIRVLKRQACFYAPQLEEIFPAGNKEEQKLLQLLDGSYMMARYSVDFRVEEAALMALFSRAEELHLLLVEAFEEIVNGREER